MLNEFLLPELDERGLVNMWFQQDGTTAQPARTYKDIVQEPFRARASLHAQQDRPIHTHQTFWGI